MFQSHIINKPYNYSASEIYEVINDLIYFLINCQDRAREGKIKGFEELTPMQRYAILNLKSKFS